MTLDTNPRSLPEQGQLVEVRQRRYVVTEVTRSALPASLLFADGAPAALGGADLHRG